MTTLAVRPQPLGIFPLPAGYLVLPDVPGAISFRDALLQGRIPTDIPPALHFYTLALANDADAAYDALADDDSWEARYNRVVLRGTPAEYAQLRSKLNGDLALLLDLVAYTSGWIDAPPDYSAADGEVRAAALGAGAAHALEADDLTMAEQLLGEAVAVARPVSPLLAAQLLGDLAEVQQQARGLEGRVVQHYAAALQLLDGSGLTLLHGQMALKLGLCYHELARGQREPLLEAVKYYQDALQILTRQNAPELYALAQNNLALAYLAMPLTEASDQLRMGIAVQALREALKVYTREAYPEQWASTQLNLANALQYLPSSHPEENLAEAVGLYEEVLQVRDPQRDPLGVARLLANQGNALAHLGIFPHAHPKLQQAAALFAQEGDHASAATVNELLAEIGERVA